MEDRPVVHTDPEWAPPLRPLCPLHAACLLTSSTNVTERQGGKGGDALLILTYSSLRGGSTEPPSALRYERVVADLCRGSVHITAVGRQGQLRTVFRAWLHPYEVQKRAPASAARSQRCSCFCGRVPDGTVTWEKLWWGWNARVSWPGWQSPPDGHSGALPGPHSRAGQVPSVCSPSAHNIPTENVNNLLSVTDQPCPVWGSLGPQLRSRDLAPPSESLDSRYSILVGGWSGCYLRLRGAPAKPPDYRVSV